MKKNKILSKMIMLAWVLAISSLATAQVCDNTYKFLRGEGTEDNPYVIDSYESLVEFREYVALNVLDRDRYVKVKADIDLGLDPNWAPIRYYDPNDQLYFQGYFDGQGHTISNLTINKRIDAVRPDEVYLGLFAKIDGEYTSLKNLNLKNVKINVDLEAEPENALDVNVGALVGYDACLVKDVNVDGEINICDESSQTLSSRHVNVGGIAGTISNDGKMNIILETDKTPGRLNADIDITSTALGSNIGGIVGFANKTDLTDCTSSGMLTGRIVEADNPVLAPDWNISIGGICGFSNCGDYEFSYTGLCSVCRVYGGNWTGGLFGYLFASFSFFPSHIHLTNCYAAGGLSDAYQHSGGLIGYLEKSTNGNVKSDIKLTDCYYAGTLTLMGKKNGKAMIGNYQGDTNYLTYHFDNCFWDVRMMTDDTDYQTLMGVATAEDMLSRLYGQETDKATGDNLLFAQLVNDDEWTFAANRYPQLNSIKDTPVSTLAVTPIFFNANDHAERVYLGARLTETQYDGKIALWSAPVGNGSVLGLRLMSDAVGYEILTLTAGTCAKRLNLYMAYSDEKWEGEAHIPTGTKDDVYDMGNGTSKNPYVIMNAGQLAYAVKNNDQNEYYQIGHDIIINQNLLSDTDTAIPWIDTKKSAYSWKADLDGNGFLVHGMYLPKQSEVDNSHQHGLLGSISSTGHVANMGLVESVITDDFTSISQNESFVGNIAGSLESGAKLENCFTSGYIMLKAQNGLLYAGGVCGKTSGIISDCINATSVMCTDRDVMTDQMGGIAGKADGASFTRCLNIGRISYYGDLVDRWEGGICPGTGYSISECYYDIMLTACNETLSAGMTTAQLIDGSVFSGHDRWTSEASRYPMLSLFAETPHMKLLSRPLTFSQGDCSARTSYILELPLGDIKWSMMPSDECLDLYADYGLAEPKANGTGRLTAAIMSSGGSSKALHAYFITVPGNFTEGIKFVDPEAEQACVEAFGSNGVITLRQAMSVTDFSPFISHSSSPSIVRFPEMRYFTGITRLTNQLSSCEALTEVELPLGLKSIAAEAFNGCSSLEMVSLPVSLTKVEPYAFKESNLKQILVNNGNTHFVSRQGVLFDENEYIVAYPPKKEGTAYIYTDPINGILTSAFQGIDELQTLYIGDDEGNYIDLKKNAIPTSMQVYVNDATDNSDYIDTYRYDGSRDWQYIDDEGHLDRYFPLKVTSAKYATMCIYFNTELPEGLKAYYCFQRDDGEKGIARFYELGTNVHAGVPVLIHGDKAGVYPLYESEEEMIEPEDLSPYYQGSGEHGFIVGDQSAGSGTTQGSILTLGHNSKGELGFFFFRSNTNKIPAYRAYLMVETLSAVNGYGISIEEQNGIATLTDGGLTTSPSAVYDLSGRKVTDSLDLHYLPKGIYIQNGKKICIQ